VANTPPVTFDFNFWIALFPEFAALNSTLGQAYFTRATGSIIANSVNNPIFGDGNLQYLIYLVTSHVAWLSCPKDANGNPSATGTPPSGSQVGRVASGTEGSVTVSFEWAGGDKKSLEAYLIQTRYGAEYWAATAQYRTARYAARPTIVVGGYFRNPIVGPGSGWW